MKINSKKVFLSLGIIMGFSLLEGCTQIALSTIPAKKAIYKKFPLESQSKQFFWSTLHQGRYDQLPEAIRLLTAAYLKNPNDPELAAFLGFAHIWMVAERQRKNSSDPTIVNHIILSKKYFADALLLDPTEPRYKGFYGDTLLAEGRTFQDEKEQAQGYFVLLDAIRAWPQFNYFTAGYPLSTLPSNSKQFKEGLQWQWKTIELCSKVWVNRYQPNFQIPQDKNRACFNSWIAPHNVEGFYLNMGDMLVKSGDWRTAVQIYNRARFERSYSTWKYRPVLEERIQNAQRNVSKFNEPKDSSKPAKEPVMMFNSKFSCTACHQN